jgi:hypothetical protein
MKYLKIQLLLFVLSMLFVVSGADGKVLRQDTVWSGRVTLKDDVLVPEGVTLTVLRGTIVNVKPTEKTRTEPEYLSSLSEITVRGRMKVEGDKVEKIVFHVRGKEGPGLWAGIIIDGGTLNINGARIENAESGIHVMDGLLKIKDSVILNNRYGMVLHNKGNVFIESTDIVENEFGIFELSGPRVSYKRTHIRDNKKRDLYLYDSVLKRGISNRSKSNIYRKRARSCEEEHADLLKDYKLEDREIVRKYGESVLPSDTVWKGRIEISGVVRVPEHVRLVIMPGTVVEFRRKDVNSDGIGDNGITVKGVLIAKGTPDNPIIFRSAETPRRMGDWGAINIMNSDGVQNLVEYAQIEDAYRGLYFHFSNVVVNRMVLKNNYRAVQFQESSVELRDNYIYGNKSGIMARDSEIVFNGNAVINNIKGTNFFRTNLTAERNYILNNMNEGISVREGTTIVRNNYIDCNRNGMLINDSFFGTFQNNVITNSSENGVSVRDSDNLVLSGNFIQHSSFTGVDLLSSGGTIKGNHISRNGERGIGIQSFAGTIIANSIANNGLYAIENESSMDILAPMNWWGTRRVGQELYDKFDNRERGMVIFSPAVKETEPYIWPMQTIETNTVWSGVIGVQGPVAVAKGKDLIIASGTKVVFDEGAGLRVAESRIIAKGREENRIVFTSAAQKPGRLWDEILLEHAAGSVFTYCDFQYATWGIHSNFTNLKVQNSTFSFNDGGMRFRRGPITISESLFTENRVGLMAFPADAVIKESELFNNETGIFVLEKGRGLTIRDNNIYANTDYNIRVGDFNVEDVNARSNWWGTENPAATIFDGRQEAGVGKVLFEPFLLEKLKFGEEEEEETSDEQTNDK